MRFKLLLSITVSSAWLLLPGCNTTDAPNDDDIATKEAAPRAASNVKDKSPDSDLKALELVTGSRATLNHAVQDVHAILVAQERQTLGDNNDTVKAWYDAMTQGRGAFGKMVFRYWGSRSLSPRPKWDLQTRLVVITSRVYRRVLTRCRRLGKDLRLRGRVLWFLWLWDPRGKAWILSRFHQPQKARSR